MAAFFDTHAHLDYPEYAKGFSGSPRPRPGRRHCKNNFHRHELWPAARAPCSLRKNFPRFTPPSAGIPARPWKRPPICARPCANWPGIRRSSPSARPDWIIIVCPARKMAARRTTRHYKKRQAEIFQQQLEVAAEFGLNAIIHQRASFDDTLAQLKPFAGKVRGVFHCFGESVERLQQHFGHRLARQLHRHRHFQKRPEHPRRRGRDAAGQVHARNRLSRISRRCRIAASAASRRCEGNFRDRRAGQKVFAGRIERRDLPDRARLFSKTGLTPQKHPGCPLFQPHCLLPTASLKFPAGEIFPANYFRAVLRGACRTFSGD